MKKIITLFLMSILIGTVCFPQIALSQETDYSEEQLLVPELTDPDQIIPLWTQYIIHNDKRYLNKILDAFVNTASDKALNIDDITFIADRYRRYDDLTSNNEVKELCEKYFSKGKSVMEKFLLSSRLLADISRHAVVPKVKQHIDIYLKQPIDKKIKEAIKEQIILSQEEHQKETLKRTQ